MERKNNPAINEEDLGMNGLSLIDGINGEIICSVTNVEKMLFDTTIGHIEDILVDPDFQHMICKFMDERCSHFEETEENKLMYTEFFHDYLALIESHVEHELQRRIPDFQMAKFLQEIQLSQGDIDGSDVFDVLRSFTDFLSFKELMLDYKAAKNGNQIDLVLGMN